MINKKEVKVFIVSIILLFSWFIYSGVIYMNNYTSDKIKYLIENKVKQNNLILNIDNISCDGLFNIKCEINEISIYWSNYPFFCCLFT